MDPTITLQGTPESEVIINRLLNGIIGTEAQRAAVIRVIKQLGPKVQPEYHAATLMLERLGGYGPQIKLDSEISETTRTIQNLKALKASVPTSQDPVDSYKSPC